MITHSTLMATSECKTVIFRCRPKKRKLLPRKLLRVFPHSQSGSKVSVGDDGRSGCRGSGDEPYRRELDDEEILILLLLKHLADE